MDRSTPEQPLGAYVGPEFLPGTGADSIKVEVNRYRGPAFAAVTILSSREVLSLDCFAALAMTTRSSLKLL